MKYKKPLPKANPLKQQLQLGVLGVLCLLAAFIAYSQFSSPARQVEQYQPLMHAAAMVLPVESEQVSRPPKLLDHDITWPLIITRDPFEWSRINVIAPVVALQAPDRQVIEAAARNKLKFQAVLLDNKPRVLLNGQILYTGSQVAGFKIKQIQERSIIVTREGVDVELEL